ncbi:MAG TPA: peptidase M14, partial [Candidatus Aphodoplasma excrementigallinarum]|nr:peptidase M14 [Candidatus Aphodoplasma excrementigallinarum]
MAYTYSDVMADIASFAADYPFLRFFKFGQSVMGKPLYGIKIGTGPKKVLYVSGHHGLEWLTSAMIMSFVRAYADAIKNGKELCGYNARELAVETTMYIVPMLNPDGIDLVAGNIPESSPYYQKLREMFPDLDFSTTWQANINGVDLNHNYNAGFDPILPGPAPSRYGGPYPESEPESRALAQLTREIDPALVIAYHSQGQEIYYDFEGHVPPRGEELAQQFARISGYTATVPTGTAAFGGYKDWFIKEYDRPGFTIEIGLGKNPIGFDQLEQVLGENICVMLYG